jgi:hypothetical protein
MSGAIMNKYTIRTSHFKNQVELIDPRGIVVEIGRASKLVPRRNALNAELTKQQEKAANR